jgi:glucose uptake protein
MLIPTTYGTVVLLAVLALMCWGSWINTLKAAGKWRFELYYYDFALGCFLVTGAAALSIGTLGAEITSFDNLAIVRKLQIGFALLAGGVFNLGNMLLAGGVTVAGISTAFPIALGTALLAGLGWSRLWMPAGNPAAWYGGAAAVLLAMVIAALNYRGLQRIRAEELAHAAAITGRKAPAGVRTVKGIVTSFAAGVLLGGYLPLVETARQGELELGPYPLAFLFACGVLATTLLYNLYFVNLPVQGEAISILTYFRGSVRQHLLGLAGGAIWGAGAIANLAASSAQAETRTSPAMTYAIGQGAAVLAMLCGVVYWKEFSVSGRLRLVMLIAAAVFTLGLALLIAALHP